MSGLLTGTDELPRGLRGVWEPLAHDTAMHGVLTPWDSGLMFETDDMHVRSLVSPYPVVRWMDQWGIWWEHKRGQIRQIKDGEGWAP